MYIYNRRTAARDARRRRIANERMARRATPKIARIIADYFTAAAQGKPMPDFTRRLARAVRDLHIAAAQTTITAFAAEMPTKKTAVVKTEWEKEVDEYLRTASGKKIVAITAGIRAAVRLTLNHISRQGLGEVAAAKVLAARIKRFSIARAARIARTEQSQAANLASNSYAKANGLKKKVWMSAQQERTRPAHYAANGQTRPMNQPFIVGGERLQHPGDPNGSAANVINCRCVTSYKFR